MSTIVSGEVVTPDPLNVATAFPTATTEGGGVATPSNLNVEPTFPVAQLVGDGIVSPQGLTLAATFPLASTEGGAVMVPDLLNITVGLPAADTVEDDPGNYTATPDALSVTVELDGTPEGGGVVLGEVIAVEPIFPIATTEGGGVAIPDALIPDVNFPVATTEEIDSGGYDAVPDILATGVSFPAIVTVGDGIVAPAPLTVTAFFPAATTYSGLEKLIGNVRSVKLRTYVKKRNKVDTLEIDDATEEYIEVQFVSREDPTGYNVDFQLTETDADIDDGEWVAGEWTEESPRQRGEKYFSTGLALVGGAGLAIEKGNTYQLWMRVTGVTDVPVKKAGILVVS